MAVEKADGGASSPRDGCRAGLSKVSTDSWAPLCVAHYPKCLEFPLDWHRDFPGLIPWENGLKISPLAIQKIHITHGFRRLDLGLNKRGKGDSSCLIGQHPGSPLSPFWPSLFQGLDLRWLTWNEWHSPMSMLCLQW